MSEFNYDNEIIEEIDVLENNETLESVEAEKEEDDKKKKKKPRKKLTKKQKIIIIVVSVILLLLIVGLILYFVVFKKEDEPKQDDKTEIVEKDNYRYENGNLVFLDKSEKSIGTYECTNKDSKKCFVTKINLETDSFDRVKSVYEDGLEIEKNSKIYFDKYVFVSDDDKIFLYNIEDKEKELDLKSIKSYSTERDLVVIEDEDSKYGIILLDDSGYEYLIRPSYDNLGIVNTDKELVLAQDKDDNYLIDINGKKLSDEIKAEVKSADDKFIVAESNKTYSLYDYNYEELVSDYDYMSLHDGIVALVKNNRLFLIDENLNKLYEDGIRLESKDYNKKYVYNEDNKLIETLKSYEITVNDNIANIDIDNDITRVNILEASVNSNISYLNYFDDKLYFYSDEEKLDLLGSYTCNNKNNIKSKDDTLTNCNIYTNELGMSGIYNNEYVFINDSTSNGDKVYYLYNLKEKKVKGTYSELDILLETELNEQIKPIYTSSSFIIAKTATGSNKGNFGVLEINSEKVQGKIAFKYESITKEGEYYKLLSVDKTYSLYDSDFERVSNEFNDIKLFTNYYVGINNNKLNVYSYTDTLGILESDLAIQSNNYEIDFTNGFTIKVDGKTYKYDKFGKVIKDEVPTNGSDEEIESVEGGNNGE